MGISSLMIYLATTSVLTFGDGHEATITADQGVYDMDRNVSVWTGDVKITEGPYVLYANSVEVHREQKTISYVVAKGKPVSITGPQEGITASLEGQVVIYDQKIQQISAHIRAQLDTTSESISAENLLYKLQGRTLEASGRQPHRVKLRVKAKPEEG